MNVRKMVIKKTKIIRNQQTLDGKIKNIIIKPKLKQISKSKKKIKVKSNRWKLSGNTQEKNKRRYFVGQKK